MSLADDIIRARQAAVEQDQEQPVREAPRRKQEPTAEGDAEMARMVAGITTGGRSRLGSLPESDRIMAGYIPARGPVAVGSRLFSRKETQGHIEESPSGEKAWVPAARADHDLVFARSLLAGLLVEK